MIARAAALSRVTSPEVRFWRTGAYGQQAALARQYEVSQNCISRLVRGVTWAT